jgi:hypothetical protein
MEKLHNFWRWFNRPAQVFEALGYIAVAVGVFIAVVGTITALIASDKPSFMRPNPLQFLIMGAIIAIVAPQLFFAIAKVVKAAEKYLGEK